MQDSFFNSGWRPVLSWLIVFVFFWAYVLADLLEVAIQLKWGITVVLDDSAELPMFELALMAVGVSGLHSYDKFKNRQVDNPE